MLDVRTAVPLALFVNEVMSNSFKHAFPDGRTGSITIEYRVDGDMRTLTARDDGVGVDPAVQPGGRTGSLGMQLARAIAGHIGRAVGRARESRYESISRAAVSLKKT